MDTNVTFVKRQIQAGEYRATTRTFHDPCSGRQEIRTLWSDSRGTVRRFRNISRNARDQTELNFWFDWAGRRDRVTSVHWQGEQKISVLRLDYDNQGHVVQTHAQPPLDRAEILRQLPPAFLQQVWASRNAALGCE
ncbi:hypothetical protein [Deinococcus radiophilus]|uniref:RHS repeat protein n=1 Tax=Deinococcus radiophilus TaxID=32062 RepID=A0A431W219_9DEIO|nr:hypothetical protein [Deinococcus radiophilus]RTR29449.1 hypothetical protein EJ104_03415 [Deinococcus radiophilus]